MISIIVPVYNKEAEVDRCVSSIIRQEYPTFECILVDDGSTDSSPEICDYYAEIDDRFSVIHKTNGGLSDARNAGLEAANGDKVTFVDADDYVDSTYLSTLNDLLESENGAQLACCSERIVKSDFYSQSEPSLDKCVNSSHSTILSTKDYLLALLYGDGVSVSAWGKLYRRELLSGVPFPKGKLYEDVEWSIQIGMRLSKAVVSDCRQYNYVMNDNSITHNIDQRVFDRYYLGLSAKDDISRLCDPDLDRAAKRYAAYHGLSVLRCGYPKNERTKAMEKEILQYLDEVKWQILTDKRAQTRDKIAITALELGIPFYRFCWKIYASRKGD